MNETAKIMKELKRYNISGNLIGVLDVSSIDKLENIKKNLLFRKHLVKEGRVLDSIMLITPLGKNTAQMVVFEPNGAPLIGSFSTMCGNGTRAVASYLRSKYGGGKDSVFKILTEGGNHNVKVIVRNNRVMYKVNMGKFVTSKKYLEKYLAGYILHHKSLENVDLRHLKPHQNISTITIGLNSASRGLKVDGEPHTVLILKKPTDMKELIKITSKLGPQITKNLNLFPKQINTTIGVIERVNADQIYINSCTFERNLGDDPGKCITGSCGTGACAISGTVTKLLGLDEEKATFNVQMPKGVLIVEKNKLGDFDLIGGAEEI